MGAGQVLEMGNHDELVEKNGAYKKLVARQLMKDEINKIDEDLKKKWAKPTISNLLQNIHTQPDIFFTHRHNFTLTYLP